MASSLVPPDLRVWTAALLDAGAQFVVVGGFAVVANRYVRSTKDVDVLVPDDATNDRACLEAARGLGATRLRDGAELSGGHLVGQAHLRVVSDSGGILDFIREGDAPLDFDTVSGHALSADLGDGPFALAGLRSVVAFKRLAGRPEDLRDLARLEEIHGPLPIDPVPGLDDA